jgi:putative mRNA 3-end processing factor
MFLANTDRGLFCAAGNFYIDPWRPVDFAIITHGHSDHARWGSKNYLTAKPGVPILQQRLGADAKIEGLPFGETLFRNGVKVSFHPAGHILGSAQVRIEHGGEICVVSGDYKTENDGISGAFEPIRCHTFVTESTFALPIYHWRPQAEIFAEINDWWRENQSRERTSVLFAYSLGKAQRILSGLDASLGPIVVHGPVEKFLPAYRDAGAKLPEVQHATAENIKSLRGKAIVIAPGSTDNSPWLRKFGDVSNAFASGWMQVRGPRRRQSLDRGFVLSDHADWDGLLKSIEATGAENIWATHGYTAPLVRWLRERGKNAIAIKTHFESETGEEGEISQKQTKGTKSEETQGRIDSEKSSFSSSLSVDEVE